MFAVFFFVGAEKGHKGTDPGDTESPELIRVKVCQESKAKDAKISMKPPTTPE